MARFSIIVPVRNGERFVSQAIRSIVSQRVPGIEVELIVVDGASTDGTVGAARGFGGAVDRLISGPDRGPADAINKGLALCGGEFLGWLNADDVYHPQALARAARAFDAHPRAAVAFGRCRIVDEAGLEIRKPITRFKEACFPFSSRFLIRTLNYVSQPALWFRRGAWEQAGPLRTDLQAAFDYDLLLRLWAHGGAARVPGGPLADFRWHPGSISGSRFALQFEEELAAAQADAGPASLAVFLHRAVRRGIVFCYTRMARARQGRARG